MKKTSLFQKFILVAVLALFSGAGPASFLQAAEQDPVIWIAEGQVLGGYSKIDGEDGLGSVLSDWLVSPTVKLSEKTRWINLYNGSYNRTSQVIVQDEGNSEVDETQNHAVTTAIKHNLTDTWSLRPHFYADWVFVTETNDESFGEGLYDHEELGGGLESAWITFSSKDREDQARLGFQAFKREYPNYQSLIYLFDPNTASEENEKDLWGYKAIARFDSRSRDGWSWGLEAISLFKDYTDKQTIDSDGIRTGDKRDDFAQYVNGYIGHPISKEFSFRLNGQFIANWSNLDFYDTHNTISPADDDFIADYYDYYSYTAEPTVLYRRALGEGRNLWVSFGYRFNVLHYPDRPAQDISGRYGEDSHVDFTHTLAARVSVPMTKQISWVTFLSYTIADSNQDFEDFYLYNYNRWSALTGVSFKY
jgi:hypothetical protein